MFRGSSWAQTSLLAADSAPAPRASRARGTCRAAPAGRWPGRSVAQLLRFGQQVVVDLAGAEHDPRGPVRACSAAHGIVEDRLEGAPRPGPPAASVACGQPQQALGRHDDQRPLAVAPRLPAEQVEVLRRRGAVGHPDVALGGELEEPLEPGARVLRALALVAVGQQQGEPGREPPLGEPRAT